MPLLARLFGRKQRDDDKTPAAEWPLGEPTLGDQSFGVAPSVPGEPSADDPEIESGNAPEPPETRADDAGDEAGTGAVSRQPETNERDAGALDVAALSENEYALDGWEPDGEDAGHAPTEGFDARHGAPEAGNGLLEVPEADNRGESSDGIVIPETADEALSSSAREPVVDLPFGEVTDPYGTLSKESADAFAASINPVDTVPLETADPFAAPVTTPSAPFNALAAASADAFEMSVEEIADPFGTPTDELPEQPAQDSLAPDTTLLKSQATASNNPFMKLVAEDREVPEGSESPGQPEDDVSPLPFLDEQPGSAQDAVRLPTVGAPLAGTEPHTLIGGKEDDIVPLIPDTATDEAEEAAAAEIDESGVAEAAIASLKSTCDFFVVRVKKLSSQNDATRVVAGLIALVGELDTRYALDMGIRRRNGVEELLLDVRGRMAEGDRFVLESLENGRGGLTADAFLRDLKTIAPSDRPRMLGHYVIFLTFMIKHVLHQYLRSLEEDQTRTYEISYHLDYLVEGVRDMLLSKVSAGVS